MTHDDAVGLLTDFVTGKLSGARQQEMQEHFRSCEECRGLVDTLRLLRAPLRENPPEPGPAGHPTSAAIVSFALTRDELGEAARQDLAAHFADCRTCGRIATLVAETGGEPGGTGNSSTLSSWWPRAALATAAVATAGMAWLGLYRVPQLKTQVAARESVAQRETPDVLRGGSLAETGPAGEPVAGPSGPIRIQSLPAPRRGGNEPPAQVTLTGDDRTLYLALDVPDLPGSGDRSWKFAVVGAGGEILWSQAITADELRRLIEAGPGTVLAVPAALVPAGRQSLRLDAADPGGPGATLIEIPFLVKRLPALNPGKN